MPGVRARASGIAVFAASCAVIGSSATSAFAGDGTFPNQASGSPFGTGSSPRDLAFGDFNNDGVLDLAVANQGNAGLGDNGQVTIRLGAGDGSFPAGSTVAAGNQPWSVAVGDLNSDGNEDLAVANRASNDLTSLLGNGSGGFTQPAGSPVATGTDPRQVAVGDFNNDFVADVAIANFGGNATVRTGDGTGAFPASSTVGAGTNPRSVSVGDFNNDGDDDLAITNNIADSASGVTVQLGGAGASFAQPASSPEDVGTSPQAVAIGEFSGDGRQDLAAPNLAGVGVPGTVTTRLGTGTGDFTPVPNGTQFGVGDGPRSITLGDFDSDGDDDLAVGNQGDHNITVRLGSGDGTFPVEPSGSPFGTGLSPDPVVAGDLNGDGNVDLATANLFGGVTVRLGGGAAPLTGNLLVNGGFEGAGAAREEPLPAGPFPAIPGWERSGNMTFARYGMAPAGIYPTHVDSPRYVTGGTNFLWGGFGASSTASQSVDVSASAASIDAGLASAGFSALLGGARAFQDRMGATAAFLDGSGTELGSLAIGPVTVTDRRNLSTLLRRSSSGPVPAGTRQIRVTLTATDDDANYSSSFADNVKLTMDAPSPPVDDDDGGGGGGGGVRDTEVEFDLSGKRKQRIAKQKGVVVKASCPDEACTADAVGRGKMPRPRTGRAALAKLRLKPVTEELAAGVTEKLKLKLKKKQLRLVKSALRAGKKPKVTVSAEAVDAAGNVATQKLKVIAKR